MAESKEIWRDIEGYEGLYQVSNLGSVRSLDRIDSIGRHRKAKILKPSFSRGYPYVNLCKKSKMQFYRIHRLVAIAFLPNPENKEEVNHIDGNTRNNCVDNLEWVTHSENIHHASKTNLFNMPKGESHWRALLTNEEIKSIRKEYIYCSREHNTRSLAKKYGVSHRTIVFIVNNKTYTDSSYGEELSKKAKPKLRPNAKLTPEQVIEIRRTYIPWDKEYGGKALAKKYGVSYSAIRDLFRKTGMSFKELN